MRFRVAPLAGLAVLAAGLFACGDKGGTAEDTGATRTAGAATIPMELIRVSKQHLGEWARQPKARGFTDVSDVYLKM